MKYAYGSYGYIAHKDLDTAKSLIGINPSFSVQCTQQAIEKLLKHQINNSTSIVGDIRASLLKTHKLVVLAKSLNLNTDYDKLRVIGDYYFEGRYPGIEYYEMSEEDAKYMLDFATHLFSQIESKQITSDVFNE